MHGRPTYGCRFRIQAHAHLRIRLRQATHALLQRFEIEHGAADQQRDAPARADVSHQVQGVLTKVSRRIRLRRRNQIN